MTEHLWRVLTEPLVEQAFQKALIGGCLAAAVCGVIGCFVILRRMAFLGDALSHAMLAGVVAGYLFMQIVFGMEAHGPAMLIGSLIAGTITVASIGFISKVSRIKDDTAIGIMYTGIFAVGGALASLFSDRIHIHLYDFIVGMVLAVEDSHLWMMAFVCASVLAVVIIFFRQLQITTFDPVMAASIGVPVVAMDYLLTTCTSLVVVSAVSVVGIILVVGLLVTPAATAYLLCDRLSRMLVVSALFGILSVVGGLYLSLLIGNVAVGSSIVIVSTFQFLIVLIVAPRYGLIADWLRRRSMVPRQLIEDVLDCIRRGGRDSVPMSTVIEHVEGRPDQLRKALRSLTKQGLLRSEGDTLALTSEGELEARRLLRAHRLWESYLEHVGTPTEQLHERAEHLEHIHDEVTVDYLDDRLGHPLRDPHGAEIPEDFVHLVPGHQIKASLLRQGHRARVTSVEQAAADTKLRVGMSITAGPRQDNGRLWTFVLPDGREVTMQHHSADAVTVELVSSGDQRSEISD